MSNVVHRLVIGSIALFSHCFACISCVYLSSSLTDMDRSVAARTFFRVFMF